MVIDAPEINYDLLITEDDEPMDNIFSEKQQRLLVESLYHAWNPGQPFIAAANIGIFTTPYQPAIVPDVLLSLDVEVAEDIWKKENRSYIIWKIGKAPDAVIEIVSNAKGGELDRKMNLYARMRVWYYAIFDPQRLLQQEILQLYQLSLRRYVLKEDAYLDQVGLGLRLWEGTHEGLHAQWLRWCDAEGQVFPTGHESTQQERQRVEQLRAQLRALGVEPEKV